jgi:hypothetical protein
MPRSARVCAFASGALSARISSRALRDFRLFQELTEPRGIVSIVKIMFVHWARSRLRRKHRSNLIHH